jgi:hypothetical protein
VWVGNDDYTDIKIQGAHAAAPIWAEFMKKAVLLPQYSDTHEFTPPEGVEIVKIDKVSNLLSDEACPDSYDAAFLDGTAPTDTCDHPPTIATCCKRSSAWAESPQARAGIRFVRGAPFPSAIGHDRIAGVFQHIGRKQAFARGDQSLVCLRARERATFAEGVDPVTKQISDLNTLPTPAITSWCSSTSPISSSRMRQQRGATAPHRIRAQHIDCRRGILAARAPVPAPCASLLPARETHRNVLAVLEHDAHVDARLLPSFAGPVDVPAAAHEHMSSQRSAAGKMNQQPLAARLHLLDRLPCKRRVVVEARQQG